MDVWGRGWVKDRNGRDTLLPDGWCRTGGFDGFPGQQQKEESIESSYRF